jgi:hypothetical protein
MASIFDNKYGEGTAFMFSSKSKDLGQFKKAKVGDITKLVVTKSNEVDIGQLNEIFDLGGNNPKTVYLHAGKKIVAVKGSEGKLKTLFNVASKGGSGQASKRTECSETTSLIIFKNKIENKKILDEDSLIDQLKKIVSKDVFELYKSAYYESAIKQVNIFQRKFSLGAGYEYERQKQNRTKAIYKNVATLGGPKDADNFNSGDLWIIKKDYARKVEGMFSSFTNINEMITEIAAAFKMKNMISVSLKQTEKGDPSVEIIDPARELKKDSNLDFSIQKINLTYGGAEKYAFNNPEIITKSGFQIRLTHKSSGFTSLFFEGKMKGTDYQMGAIDIGKYKNKMEEVGYQIFNNNRKPNVYKDQGIRKNTINEIDKILNGSNPYKSIFSSVQINLLKQYKEEFERGIPDNDFNRMENDRFIHFVTTLYSILFKVKDIKEHMKFAFNLARKVQEFSSVYVKVIG